MIELRKAICASANGNQLSNEFAVVENGEARQIGYSEVDKLLSGSRMVIQKTKTTCGSRAPDLFGDWSKVKGKMIVY